jgi:hypothetical protein
LESWYDTKNYHWAGKVSSMTIGRHHKQNPGRWTIIPDWMHSSPSQSSPLSLLVKTLVLLLVSIAVLSGGALATPPSDVKVTYDQNAGDLIVSITHPVADPTTHYIKQVTVNQGSTVLADNSYTSQPDPSTFIYRYNLPQLKGGSGEIQVTATCNMFGSRSTTLMLPSASVPGNTGIVPPVAPAPTKSPLGMFVAFVAIGFVARHVLK